MAATVRITLTQLQAGSVFGQRLVHQILAMSHDGDISVDDVSALHATLLDGPADMNAVPFLRQITIGILADGCVDEVEAYQLRRAMERVVPKSVRMKLTELLSQIGLPSHGEDDDIPGAGGHNWRNDPATARQVLYIENLGGRCTAEMTKGDAARLIDGLLERRPPSPRQQMLLRFFDRLELSSKTKEEVSAWVDRLYIDHEDYERAWHLFKIDIGDDGSIRDPEVVPIGAYRKYLRVKRPAPVQQQARPRLRLGLLFIVIAVTAIIVYGLVQIFGA